MKKQQPNILLIMFDQLRADSIGCAQNSSVRTPNIDKLAKQGIRFTQAICNSPTCVPSRASVMSGKYPHRLGVLNNHFHFPKDEKTYMQALRRAGYQVAGIGKLELHKPDQQYGKNGDAPINYHLGYTMPFETEGKMSSAKSRSGSFPIHEHELVGSYQHYLFERGKLEEYMVDYQHRDKQPVWYSAPSVLEEDDVADAFIGQKACEFIDNVSTEYPWFCSVNFLSPHDPWDAPMSYYELYDETIFPPSIKAKNTGKPDWIKKRQEKHLKGMTDNNVVEVKKHYAGMITHLDHWVGKLLQCLKNRDLDKNTIVIFTSDHGEMLGDHGLFQKQVMYESSIRVPLIISDPTATTWNGALYEGLVELVDLYPTILDMAGVYYEQDKLDGKSLYPLLVEKERHHKDYQYCEWENCWMIRNENYKLIFNYNDSHELYNLLEDPNEEQNIIEEYPQIAKEYYDMANRIKER
ncbi:sulfatase family protein [Alkalihalobacterium bogoriense]|uniref:sulfatase family protein n=1 Tax=Alkalihalobacterium bogoriense TaxID=246272 RepID=UPI00068661EA|nr:sulfatase-like hydrolase/transferase [Alkalihalobacterium bogoriense]